MSYYYNDKNWEYIKGDEKRNKKTTVIYIREKQVKVIL